MGITYEKDKVNSVISALNEAKSTFTYSNTYSELNSGATTIQSATGFSSLGISSFSQITSKVSESEMAIDNVITAIEGKISLIDEYNSDGENNHSFLSSAKDVLLGIGGSIGMVGAKLGEGFVSGAEEIVDGFVSVAGGFILGNVVDGVTNFFTGGHGTKIKETVGKIVETDVSGKIFNYDKGPLKALEDASYLKRDSAVLKAAELVGYAGAYVTAGYIAQGVGAKAAAKFASSKIGTALPKAANAVTKVTNTLTSNAVRADMTAAFLGGAGKGTERELQDGDSFNKAFITGGLPTGVTHAAVAGIAHVAGKGVDKVAGKVFSKTGTPAIVDKIANSTIGGVVIDHSAAAVAGAYSGSKEVGKIKMSQDISDDESTYIDDNSDDRDDEVYVDDNGADRGGDYADNQFVSSNNGGSSSSSSYIPGGSSTGNSSSKKSNKSKNENDEKDDTKDDNQSSTSDDSQQSSDQTNTNQDSNNQESNTNNNTNTNTNQESNTSNNTNQEQNNQTQTNTPPTNENYQSGSDNGSGNYHTGGGYSGSDGYQSDSVLENNDNVNNSDTLEDVITDTNTDSIDDVIKNNYTKIPSSSEPIQQSSSKGGSRVIPIVAGLSAAAAAGIGAKVYLDNKTNNDNGEDDEDIETEEWSGEDNLNIEYDDNNANEENYLDDDDEFGYQSSEEPTEKYDARSNEELADLQ